MAVSLGRSPCVQTSPSDGKGGALSCNHVCAQSRFLQIVVRTLCVLGVGMIMGDGVLTPAISVVSAIEGLGQIPGGGGNIERSE